MQELNDYLQQLISKSGSALILEPNKQPLVVTSNGHSELSNTPMAGARINTMIFSLIPQDVKKQLPNNSQVEFVHPHNLGDFNFVVKKSPSGFIVSVNPLGSSQIDESIQSVDETQTSQYVQPPISSGSASANKVEQTSTAPTQLDVPISQDVQNEVADQKEEELVVELNSPPQKKNEFMNESSLAEDLLTTSDYAFESAGTPEMSEYLPEETPVETSSFEQYPEIEIEYNSPIQEDSLEEEQVYEIEQLSFQNETPTTNVEDTIEISNNMNQEYKAPVNKPVSNERRVQPPKQVSPQPQQPVQAQVAPQQQTVPQQMQQPAVQQQPQVQAPTPVAQEPAKVSASPVAANPQAKAKMDALFHKMNEVGASDLHMSVSVPPMVRKDGRMAKLDQSQPALTADTIKELLQSIMPQKNIEEFEERKDTDFAYEIKGLARFRANIFMDRKGMGGVFRIIPSDIMTAEDLNLSKHIMNLCELSKGLVVVTGPTGSGKSTTLCAMVDSINKNREDHIITIEDPIEFTHENKKCLVNQREVHNHTSSFKDALRAALREDPDILLVGEMRDLETISIAIETAETGHLVFGTLHTTTAASTIDRIIDQFPADRQEQIRVMLSESLRGVIAQTLLPKIGGGRIAALEVLLVTPAVSNLIREGKTFQIPSAMQTGKNKGMVMLNDALMDLVNKNLVTPKDAYIKSVDKDGFELLLKRHGKSI